MITRTLALSVACGALGWGGYEYSNWRAGFPSPSQALAAAGEASLLAASEEESKSRYRISSLAVFSNVTLHIKDNYVDPARIDPPEMLAAALEEIERQVAEVLVERVGPSRIKVRVMDHEKDVFIDDVGSLWSVNLKLREVFRFFELHLPPQDDVRDIEYAAINGALSTLDPHSVLLKPEAFAEMKTSTKGEFGGLGIVISIRDGKLTVISPLDGTPASRAGLKAGDQITRIGEVSTVSMPIEEAVQLLRGPEGSLVTIWVSREDWAEPRAYELKRERIKIESVEGELLSRNVGYIQIKNFQQNTGKDLETQLSKLKKEAADDGLVGLILDLRNNPGGLLEQAIRVSDKFVTSGDIVTTVGYGNQLREPKRARWSGTEAKLPLAVLVNQGSASASEIVAGALKNLDRGTLIGERTFGKGSVQVLYDFADNSALKLTIAQYLTPGGVSIQSEGVVPDIALHPAWIEEDSARLFYEPDVHREANLEKHLDRAGNRAFETRPVVELTYLVEPTEDGSETNTENDYLVRFAQEFLLRTRSSTRREALEAGESFLKARASEEQARIHERLASIGVDWSEGENQASPELELTLSLMDHEDGIVSAGEEVQLEASVTNRSSAPLHRLRGVVDSEHPAFKGREFLFGRVEPEQTIRWTVTTQVPKDAWNRSDRLRLVLSDDANELPSSVTLDLFTRMARRPEFAYSVLIDDRERGDGDGVLEVGEAVDLKVLLTNVGDGLAEDVTVRLKSGAGENLFLERGRDQLESVEPGASAVSTLKFRIPEEADGTQLPLELAIYDSGTGAWLEDRFSLAARAQDGRRGVPFEAWVELDRGAEIHDSPEARADPVATVQRTTRVRAVGRSHGFVHVEFLEGAVGFVSGDAVQREVAVNDDKAVEEPDSMAIKVAQNRIPPRIELDATLGTSIEAADVVQLKGRILASTLRDYYVILNDEKVFFDFVEEASNGSKAQPVPISVPLALEPGLNKILVVARQDEQLMAIRYAFVSREASPGSDQGPAVAEAREDPRSSNLQDR
ncbi:MAG: MXAN_5808 family serine peptidase [Myxococcota bacterium]